MIVERWLQARGRPLLAIILLAGPSRRLRTSAPEGAAPLRYRDGVFSSVGVQSASPTAARPIFRATSAQTRPLPADRDTAARRLAIVWYTAAASPPARGPTPTSSTRPRATQARLRPRPRSATGCLLNGCGGAATSECVTAAIAAKHDGLRGRAGCARQRRQPARGLEPDRHRRGLGRRHRAAREPCPRTPAPAAIPATRRASARRSRSARPAEQRHDRLGRVRPLRSSTAPPPTARFPTPGVHPGAARRASSRRLTPRGRRALRAGRVAILHPRPVEVLPLLPDGPGRAAAVGRRPSAGERLAGQAFDPGLQPGHSAFRVLGLHQKGAGSERRRRRARAGVAGRRAPRALRRLR